MLIVRATKKLLDRVGPPTLTDLEASTTLLGDWYATVLFWRPQVALLVSEETLLPVLMPLAPAATLLQRFGPQLAVVLAAHGPPQPFIDTERQQIAEVRLAKTANRSIVGIRWPATRPTSRGTARSAWCSRRDSWSARRSAWPITAAARAGAAAGG